MGIPYFTTCVYKFLAPQESHPNAVNLQGGSIVIDANSFKYDIYDRAMEGNRAANAYPNSSKSQLRHESFFNQLDEALRHLKNKCKDLVVVFDGVYGRAKHKRPDPKRRGTIRFDELQGRENQLPSLFHFKFQNILRDLKIPILVARGEADAMIAELANMRDAYVLAGDSDYHLYDLKKGYVPLRFLNRRELQGLLYQRQDIFPSMDQDGVALWESMIIYDFVDLEKLEVRVIFR